MPFKKAWSTRDDVAMGRFDMKLLISSRDVFREPRSSTRVRYSADAPRHSLRAFAMS
jgi:hypothetical protein